MTNTVTGSITGPRDLSRVVDSRNHGWLLTGSDGIYEGFDPTLHGGGLLSSRPLAQIEAEFGPWRPVRQPTGTECDELREAFALAGRQTVASIASALDTRYDEARNRFGPWDSDAAATAAYAQRSLTAGRPGSWEAAAVMDVVLFGNELNLHHRTGAGGDVAEMRARGPHPKRVHLQARDRIAAVLRAWTTDTDRYTEVPETLAGLLGAYADENYGAGGWRAIADQWLQPGALDTTNTVNTYRLLYSTSQHFDATAIAV